MHVLILGGTGFTGQALIKHLRGQSPAVDVTVVSRTATEVPGVERVRTGHYADLIGSAAFRRELADFDAIVHLGDGLSILQERQHAADTAQADRLLASCESLAVAARDAQVPLAVFVSSIKALCDEEDSRVLVEASEPRSTTLYGRSKLRLEEVVTRALAGSGTRQVIVRNPVMYGAGKAGSVHRLMELVDTPCPLPLGGLVNRRSVLAVGNFASALAAIVRAGSNGPRGVFHVHDGAPLSTTEMVAALRVALGRPQRLFPIGATLAHMARQVPLAAANARRLYGSLELSDAHFRQCFHWQPIVDTKAALAEMAARFSGRAPSR